MAKVQSISCHWCKRVLWALGDPEEYALCQCPGAIRWRQDRFGVKPPDPYDLGFQVASREITARVASRVQARERGIFERDQDARIEWDRGYEDCVCAYRLGHDVASMAECGIFAPSLMETHAIVAGLLDGSWPHPLRPDPRAY